MYRSNRSWTTRPLLVSTVALVTFGLGPAVAVSATIASVTRLDGTAILSKGARYIPGSEGALLKTGDRLLVLEGGQATVQFDDYCVYTLTDQEILDIKDLSTCAQGVGGEYRPDLAVAIPASLETSAGTGTEDEPALQPDALSTGDQTAVAGTTGSETGTTGTAGAAGGGAQAAGAAGGSTGGFVVGLSIPAMTALAIIGGVAVVESMRSHSTDDPQPEPLSK